MVPDLWKKSEEMTFSNGGQWNNLLHVRDNACEGEKCEGKETKCGRIRTKIEGDSLADET